MREIARSGDAAQIIALVARTMSGWPDVQAIALVGSYARGAARPDSDVDLVILVTDPQVYRTNRAWLDQIPWYTAGAVVQSTSEAQYGPVWSCFLTLASQLEIECSFSSPQWAATNPVDSGTAHVVGNGCRALYDPHQMLRLLLAQVSV